MKTVNKFFGFLLITSIGLFTGCNNDDEVKLKDINLQFTFDHQVNGSLVTLDEMIYTNAAGNEYEVTEVQWFISDVELLTSEDESYLVEQDDNVHYIDTNIPTTFSWTINEPIPAKDYNRVKFTFGLKDENNTVARFPDIPETNMIWPFPMGGDNGGYHYMKLNGFWMDTLDIRQPFNFHLGVGRTMENDVPIFHQNWFEVTLGLSTSESSESLTVPIVMNIEKWFENPNVWDFNSIGGRIMNNQEAMKIGCENGMENTFTIGSVD